MVSAMTYLWTFVQYETNFKDAGNSTAPVVPLKRLVAGKNGSHFATETVTETPLAQLVTSPCGSDTYCCIQHATH